MSVLDSHGLSMIADDMGLVVRGFRAADRCFDKGHAVYMFRLRTGYSEVVLALLLWGEWRGQRQALR